MLKFDAANNLSSFTFQMIIKRAYQATAEAQVNSYTKNKQN